jgi:hypothetical protein
MFDAQTLDAEDAELYVKDRDFVVRKAYFACPGLGGNLGGD